MHALRFLWCIHLHKGCVSSVVPVFATEMLMFLLSVQAAISVSRLNATASNLLSAFAFTVADGGHSIFWRSSCLEHMPVEYVIVLFCVVEGRLTSGKTNTSSRRR